MKVTKHQISKLESIINEGFLAKDYAIEGRKNYLNKVQTWIDSTCKENNEDTPIWLYMIQTEKVSVAGSTLPDDKIDFIGKQIECCIQMLQDMRTVYYTQLQLEESHKQTKRLLYANWISFAAVIAAITRPFLTKCCVN